MKRHETVLFVDSSVRHAHLLVEGLDPDARVHRLSSWGDPLSEIASVVSRAAPVGRLAILTHGSPGTFTLSGQRVDRETLASSAETLAKIRAALAPGADALLMACSTGANRAGREFIAGLEAHLGVPVHASETDLGADAGWSGLAAAATIFAPSALASYPERLNVDPITGTAGDDDITGTTSNDTISGLAGDDTISAAAGNDIIYGNDGNDYIDLGTGEDVAYGGAGNDTLSDTTTDSSSTVYGGAGNDYTTAFYSSTGSVFYGGDGDDTLIPPGGAGTGTGIGITIYGDAGNDSISSDDGPDTIYGGSGNDTLWGDDFRHKGLNLIYGDEGNDVIYAGGQTGYSGGGGATVYGGAGDDIIYAGGFGDTLVGGAGADTFRAYDDDIGNLNGDTLFGLEAGDAIYVQGTDLSSLNGTTVGSTISLGGSNSVSVADASETLKITASVDAGNTTLTFTSAAASSSGGSASGSGLTVTNQTSEDTAGTATGRTLVNNTGSTATGALVQNTGSGNTVTATLPSGLSLTNSGTSTAVTSTAATTSLTQQIQTTEPVVGAQSFLNGHGQTFINNSGGMALDVRTIGFSGAGSTAQTIQITGSTSTSGSEAFVIDTSGLPTGSTVQLDNIEFAAIVGSATVNGGGGQNYVVGDDANQFISLGAEDDTLAGGGGNDTVGSAWGEDIVYGNQGTDYVFGGGGMDTLYGGQGADTAFGGNDNDVVYGNKGNDTLSGGGNDDLLYGGQNEDLVYGNAGNDTLAGNLGDDTLYGGQGADYLAGDSGADLLVGNAGNDTLVGGDGADTFLFTAGGGSDQINDFQSGIDSLQFGDGLTYTSAESGSNTVLTLSDGGTVTLIGTSQSSLGINASSDWGLM